MGYYSTLYIDISKDAMLRKDYEEIWNKALNEDIDLANSVFAEVRFGVIASPGGFQLTGLYFDDWNQKFYEDEKFARVLSRMLAKGWVDLKFIGEDDSMWGWRVTPGHIEPLRVIWVPESAKIILL